MLKEYATVMLGVSDNTVLEVIIHFCVKYVLAPTFENIYWKIGHNELQSGLFTIFTLKSNIVRFDFISFLSDRKYFRDL